MDKQETLESAVRVLVRLVRREYGDDRALSQIAFLWGDATVAERQALDELEAGEK